MWRGDLKVAALCRCLRVRCSSIPAPVLSVAFRVTVDFQDRLKRSSLAAEQIETAWPHHAHVGVYGEKIRHFYDESHDNNVRLLRRCWCILVCLHPSYWHHCTFQKSVLIYQLGSQIMVEGAAGALYSCYCYIHFLYSTFSPRLPSFYASCWLVATTLSVSRCCSRCLVEARGRWICRVERRWLARPPRRLPSSEGMHSDTAERFRE